MSPVINNTNPLIDLRSLFDEFHAIRSAEWNGFYSTDLGSTPDNVSDRYRNLIEQLIPTPSNLVELVKSNKARRIEIDLSHLDIKKGNAGRDYQTDLNPYNSIATAVNE